MNRMGRTTSAVMGALLAASGLALGSGPAIATPSSSDGHLSSGPAVDLTPLTGRQPLPEDASTSDAEAAAVRKQFGLRSDDTWIAAVAADPASTTTSLGVPLTSSESAEIEDRSLLNKWNGAVLTAGEKSPFFGGVRIDQAAGGVINIQIVDSTKTDSGSRLLQSALTALLPDNIKSEITFVPYSYIALQSAYDKVVGALTAGQLKAYNVTSVGLEGSTLTITTSDTATDELKAKFDFPFVRVIGESGVDFQTGRNHTSGPVYGGEWISSSSGAQCTAGYSHAVGGASNSSFYEITAGHCDSPGKVWHQGLIYSDGNKFGTATSNNGAFAGTTSKCDCQSIGPVPASAATTRVYTSYTATFAYTGLPTNTNDSGGYGVGRRVCVSGAADAEDHHGGGVHCGTIESQNFTETTPGGVYVTNLITTSITDNEQGDSGAPYGDGGDFMGIHSGRENYSPYHGIFSRSVYIASVTGATPTF